MSGFQVPASAGASAAPILENWDDEAEEDAATAEEKPETCPICLVTVMTKEYKVPSACGHPMFLSCRQKMITSGADACPLCRRPMGALADSRMRGLHRTRISTHQQRWVGSNAHGEKLYYVA
jgi:hypothetical protein